MVTKATCAVAERGLCDCGTYCTHDLLTPEHCREIYERLLPGIRAVAWTCGYSIGVHGSMRRDLDLIAAPWIEHAAPAEVLIEQLTTEVHGVRPGAHSIRPHGRRAWSIHLHAHFHMYLDISVMPRQGDIA